MQGEAINSTWGRSVQESLLINVLSGSGLCGLQCAKGIVNPFWWKWGLRCILAPQKSIGCCPSSPPASQRLPLSHHPAHLDTEPALHWMRYALNLFPLYIISSSLNFWGYFYKKSLPSLHQKHANITSFIH